MRAVAAHGLKWSTYSGHLVKVDRLFRGGVREQGDATSVYTGVKADAVARVEEQGYKIVDAARALGIDRKQLDRWLARAQVESGTALDSRDAELAHLREEVRKLRIERAIPKKAAAFFANESN